MGRAAELCETPLEAFMEFAGERGVALHYGIDEREQVAAQPNACCCDCCFRFVAADHLGADWVPGSVTEALPACLGF